MAMTSAVRAATATKTGAPMTYWAASSAFSMNLRMTAPLGVGEK
jgi:hypothetical protein